MHTAMQCLKVHAVIHRRLDISVDQENRF